jgi:preprotein translocase subunit SecD
MRHLLPLILLPILACSSPDPLPADAAGVSLHTVVQGTGAATRVVETGERLCCLGERLLDQERIASVEVVKGLGGVPEVRLGLDAEGARIFSQHAEGHVGQRVAVMIGDELRVAPLLLPEIETSRLTLTVRQPSGAQATADDLAARIRPGIGKSSPTP